MQKIYTAKLTGTSRETQKYFSNSRKKIISVTWTTLHARRSHVTHVAGSVIHFEQITHAGHGAMRSACEHHWQNYQDVL